MLQATMIKKCASACYMLQTMQIDIKTVFKTSGIVSGLSI